jgi:hypothetical protein
MKKITYSVDVYENGDQAWRYDDMLHRLDGPAWTDANLGEEQWWFEDNLHRENGPAIVRTKGGDPQWFIHGKELTEEQFNARNNPPSCAGTIVVVDGKKYKLVPSE